LGNVFASSVVQGCSKVAKIATSLKMFFMALLPILCFPDPKLHKIAKPVAHVDAQIQSLIADMFETMYEAKGIGLAATQIDVHQRVIVIDISENRDQPIALVNPTLTWTSETTHVNEEGCLSVPGIYDGVVRFDAVQVSAADESGQIRTIEADGLLAVCIQHEMDHLLGKVFVEYLSPLKRNRIKTKMLKAQRDYTL
jgi:peptide deformylase